MARVRDTVLNVMSLLLVGVGLALTATFFVGSPFADQEAEAAGVIAREPSVPAITPRPEDKALGKPASDVQQGEQNQQREVVYVPRDKTLRITVPEMSRVRNSTIPSAGVTDEDAF